MIKRICIYFQYFINFTISYTRYIYIKPLYTGCIPKVMYHTPYYHGSHIDVTSAGRSPARWEPATWVLNSR
jgi:hypothetical protein